MALSPLAVLERGYSITFDQGTGKVLRSSAEVDEGAALRIKLASGGLDAEVTGKE
jgi:exodeoxyribonuclease VII large subunit